MYAHVANSAKRVQSVADDAFTKAHFAHARNVRRTYCTCNRTGPPVRPIESGGQPGATKGSQIGRQSLQW